MRPLRSLVAAIALAALPASLIAQETGSLDLSLLFRYSMLDDKVASGAGLGVGARAGVFLWQDVALEAVHAATKTSDSPEARQGSFHLHLARHYALNGQWTAILGAGWVRDLTNPVTIARRLKTDGASAVVGIQRNFNERAALRLDAIYDHLPVTRFDAARSSASHLHLQAGLVIRRQPADSDGDGISNTYDACPNTAAGTPIDARGCGLDADGDGVSDNADRCPNTPAGTPVTADGCPRDSDSDGVTDNNDRCPNTPAGTPVTADGCPRDSDGDNVPDNVDRCPNTPAGTPVNAEGCPRDTDGDGVLDNADRCADTPAGTRVDANGCPVPLDADSDGVRDIDDRCPNTPPGTRVDARGCQLVFEEGQRNIVLEGVNFETGRAVLTAESQSILDRVAESLVASPEVNIEVQGHTDNTGSLAGNNRISQQRADAVRQYLISKGVAANRLTARGYGPSQPAASNTTAAGRAQNRRVELRRTN